MLLGAALVGAGAPRRDRDSLNFAAAAFRFEAKSAKGFPVLLFTGALGFFFFSVTVVRFRIAIIVTVLSFH